MFRIDLTQINDKTSDFFLHFFPSETSLMCFRAPSRSDSFRSKKRKKFSIINGARMMFMCCVGKHLLRLFKRGFAIWIASKTNKLKSGSILLSPTCDNSMKTSVYATKRIECFCLFIPWEMRQKCFGTTRLRVIMGSEVKITGSLSNLLFLETMKATNQNRGHFFRSSLDNRSRFPFEVNACSNRFVFDENAIDMWVISTLFHFVKKHFS